MSSRPNTAMFHENGVRKNGGFFPGIFPKDFDVKFLCRHCQLILRNPVQGTCGHRFCRSCWDEILQVHTEVDCPACIEEPVEESEAGKLSANEMFPDKGVKREMSSISCACAFPGCTWRGIFRDYEVHEQTCKFREVACALCSKPIADGQIEQHRHKDCSHRPVTCDHCGANMIFKALKGHHESCDKFPLTCDLCGKSNIARELMKNHQEQNCPKRSISCPMGCLEQFPLDKLCDHLRVALEPHLAWTIQRIMTLDQVIQDTINSVGPANLSQVKTSINGLEKKVQNVERQLLQTLRKSPALDDQSPSPSGNQEGASASDAKPKSSELAAKESLLLVEPILGVIHNELKGAIHTIQTLDAQHRQQQALLDEYNDQNQRLQQQIRLLQKQIHVKEAALTDLELRLAAQEMVRYDGTILWKVSDFAEKKREAMTGHTTSLYSPAFYSGPCGYKMCARIYPNGDGVGKGTHISLFFVIMKGHFDALLPWPFVQKVTLMMIDQNHKEHIVDAFKPDVNSTSFKRPTTEMNIASGCPLFLPLDKLLSPHHGYLRDDTIFVKIIVDTDGLDRYTEMNPGRFTSSFA